ncbi:MAG: sterol desaturase family protein [Ancalomicrobiaceae bacterium]|nr:sterol desaturase family protein [Ancalomicrobiaceae bacterium]
MLFDCLALYLSCLFGLLALYFACGFAIARANARHPERRIQSRSQADIVAAEIRQSIMSLAQIAALLAGGLFCQAKGWTLAPIDLAPARPLSIVWGLALFGLSLVLYDAWFYWGHRLMHSRRLYRFHALHHRSIVPTPWSNNSDTAVGTFVEQAYFLVVPFVLPLPAALIILHKLYDQVTGMIGHAGHEYFAAPTARFPWPMLCTTFHDQHHGSFRYNFANTFSIWDRLMGTLHPSYDQTVKRLELPAEAAHGD